MLDLDAERSTAPLSVAAITQLQAMKTGALLRFSVEAGARLAGADPAASAALSTYGRAIGAAFQIADDILDAESDAATLGKRAGKDAERNKATLVGALGVEGARRELARLVDAGGIGGRYVRSRRRRRRIARDRALRRNSKKLKRRRLCCNAELVADDCDDYTFPVRKTLDPAARAERPSRLPLIAPPASPRRRPRRSQGRARS